MNMKWNPAFNKKWITPESSAGMQMEDRLFNACMLVAWDRSGDLIGFVVADPRDVNGDFFHRLKARMETPGMAGSKLELFAPAFLAHRLEALQGEMGLTISVTLTSFLSFRLFNGSLAVRAKVRVVNVDDSPVLLKFLENALSESGWIEVVGQVSKSPEAVDAILRLNPDVVTLDIQMPHKNGVEVLRELLGKRHFPVLMISSLNLEEGSLVFEALMAGAFDYLQKPSLSDRRHFQEELSEKVLHALQGVHAHASLQRSGNGPKGKVRVAAGTHFLYPSNLVWCIGASTGGTQALTRVLTSLPERIPPVLIVQHIPAAFSKAFAESVNNLCPFDVKEAEDGEAVKANHVYVAAGGRQMAVRQTGAGLFIVLNDDEPVNRFRPSVDYLFRSVAKLGNVRVVAGVLTGMGRDGADGLLALKKSGAVTFAQDESSSIVYGMPRAAKENGAADHVCHLDQVSEHMLTVSQEKKVKAG